MAVQVLAAVLQVQLPANAPGTEASDVTHVGGQDRVPGS